MNPYQITLNRTYPSNINFDKKLVYIHVPKCGGTYIKKCIGGFKGDSHLKCSDIPIQIYQSLFSISFVRNPWDRVLSAYNYLSKGGCGNEYDTQSNYESISHYENFNDFVLRDGLALSKLQVLHFFPQSFFLDRPLDFIGKIENLHLDITMLPNVFTSVKLDTVKDFSKKLYRQFYTSNSKKIVEHLYKEDIERFQYSF